MACCNAGAGQHLVIKVPVVVRCGAFAAMLEQGSILSWDSCCGSYVEVVKCTVDKPL